MSLEFGLRKEPTPQKPTIYDQLLQIRQAVEQQSREGVGVVTVPLAVEDSMHELRVGTIEPVEEDGANPPIFFHIDDEWLRADPDGTISVHDKRERGFHPAESHRMARLGGNLLNYVQLPENA